MLHRIMMVLVAGVALAAAQPADAFHGGGGGGHVGGSFVGGGGGAHLGGGYGGAMGGGFGGAHFGGGVAHFGGSLGVPHIAGSLGGPHLGAQASGRAFVGPNFDATRGRDRGFGGHFDHDRRFVRGWGYWPGQDYGYASSYDDNGCGYAYPYYRYYNYPYRCYQSWY